MNNFSYNRRIELIIFTVLSLIVAFYLDQNFMPAEDASILFRYSENLADTGVISYNLNGKPTEGATDFLWMIILSIFYFFGVNIYFSAIFINLLSLYYSISLIRKYYSLSNIHFYVLLFLHFSITYTYAALLGFSVLFVQLLLVLVVINFFKKNIFNTLLFSFIGCLVRPDFILFIIIPNLFLFFKNFNLKNIILYSLFFLLGLIYFYGRYKYFDLLLPLPFYIKNKWDWFNNIEWGRQIIILSPILLSLFFVNIRKIFRTNILILVSITIFATLYYTNQILYQNVGYRFYFYFTLFCVFVLYEFKVDSIKTEDVSKFIIIIIALFSITINLFQNFNSFKFFSKKEDLYLFSKHLKNINNNFKVNLATTEAGLIPYYSKIDTVDLFGLNSKRFAKKPADGSLFLEQNFDMIIINSDVTGKNCDSLKEAFDKSKNLNIKNANRNDDWSKFTIKLLYGIDFLKYDSYFLSYPTNIFINKYSKAYKELSKYLEKINHLKCYY